MTPWLLPDEAAAALRITTAHAHVLAHREGWRKRRRGRMVWYHVDDVAETERRRAEARAGQTTPV